MKRILFGLESCLTVPPFIVSWLVCAIGLSVMAGYRMAKADRAQKQKILETLTKGQP